MCLCCMCLNNSNLIYSKVTCFRLYFTEWSQHCCLSSLEPVQRHLFSKSQMNNQSKDKLKSSWYPIRALLICHPYFHFPSLSLCLFLSKQILINVLVLQQMRLIFRFGNCLFHLSGMPVHQQILGQFGHLSGVYEVYKDNTADMCIIKL